MNTIGAQYCVYEDSGTLVESIRRIYRLMDKILILFNYNPWCGVANLETSFETYKKVREIPDPDNKIMLISQHWKNETEQRTFGQDLFHKMGIKWCFIVDDDELFNPDELMNAIHYLYNTKAYAVLTHQQVYWKTREYCIANLTHSVPTFVLTDRSKVFFNYCRTIKVIDGTWETIGPETIVAHHLSYVRTDAQLLRKIETFSHGDEVRTDGKDVKTIWHDWFRDIWSKWTLDMTDLHVNPNGRSSFSKAIEVKNAKYQLK